MGRVCTRLGGHDDPHGVALLGAKQWAEEEDQSRRDGLAAPGQSGFPEHGTGALAGGQVLWGVSTALGKPGAFVRNLMTRGGCASTKLVRPTRIEAGGRSTREAPGALAWRPRNPSPEPLLLIIQWTGSCDKLGKVSRHITSPRLIGEIGVWAATNSGKTLNNGLTIPD
jgi:hypothetical protein